ncbi:MAG: adenylate/guanylate cyclase domain-containing protein [Alphaproteobacteria bacterium]|nr:adenylate/guanylate cyclase domain-containing protein [Alphaproteobacteria bacterium]
MAGPGAEQRLAAILAADVAGYSQLMEADAEATVLALEACRAVFRDHVQNFGGRIVDTAGDSVLAVFPSTIGAVEASLAIQEALGERNAALAEDRRMRFRIGVNLGDVIEKPDGSIYGSGVNVAARLEGLAEPGGICLSGNVHEQVEGKLDAAFKDIGEHEVKNIAKPVRAYMRGSGTTAAPARQSHCPGV